MITRKEQSDFLNNLDVSEDGMVRIASKKAKRDIADTKEEAMNILTKFDTSPDVPNDYINKHKKRIEAGETPKEVVEDFFKGLNEVKTSNKKLTIRTAKLFRQHGLFKVAERNVYQDLKCGDFWKISEDKKYIERMFEEKDGVIEG